MSRTVDGGSQWSTAPGVHVDIHAFAFSADGSKLYVGTDGGVWWTTTYAATTVIWIDTNATLAITQFYPGVSLHPANLDFMVGGTQDNGTQRYLGSPAWEYVGCGDGGATLIDLNSPSTVYIGCFGRELYKSVSSGGPGTYGLATTGFDPSDRYPFIVNALAMDPSNSQTLYYGNFRVYRSTSAASSWSPISPDLTSGNYLSTLAVAPSDPATVYAGTFDGLVQFTHNATGSSPIWTRSNGLPGRAITQIAVDYNNHSLAYLTASGFNSYSSTTGHVFRTTDGGSNWTNISGNLPDIPANDIVIDPDRPGTLYVATDIGVFGTRDGGTTWFAMGMGLPRSPVTALRLHRATRTLRAATHGRSIWDLSVPLLPATADFSDQGLSFGNQKVGTRSAAITVSLTNSGDQTLTITSITLTGLDSAEFMQATTCGSSLVAGAQCQISATFQPAAAGNRSARIEVASNVAGSPHIVNLSGVGTIPQVMLSAGTLSFDGQLVGTTSSGTAVTLSNSGSAVLSVISIAVVGADAADFAQTNNCGSSIAPGSSCAVTVTFRPTAAGVRASSLVFTDDASGSPHSVALSGNGTDFSIAPAAGSPTSATVVAGQTAMYTLSLSSVNGFGGNVTLACSGAPARSTCSVSPSAIVVSTSPATIVVSVTTTQRAGISWFRFPEQTFPIQVFLLGTALLWVTARRLVPAASGRLARLTLALTMALLLTGILTACGGGGSGTPPPPSPPPGTQPGTYTIQVSASSGGVSRSIPLTLTVQ